jgi:hypothetical protein
MKIMFLWIVFDVFKLEKVGQDLRESHEQYLMRFQIK